MPGEELLTIVPEVLEMAVTAAAPAVEMVVPVAEIATETVAAVGDTALVVEAAEIALNADNVNGALEVLAGQEITVFNGENTATESVENALEQENTEEDKPTSAESSGEAKEEKQEKDEKEEDKEKKEDPLASEKERLRQLAARVLPEKMWYMYAMYIGREKVADKKIQQAVEAMVARINAAGSVKELEGLEKEIRRGRILSFVGKMLFAVIASTVTTGFEEGTGEMQKEVTKGGR